MAMKQLFEGAGPFENAELSDTGNSSNIGEVRKLEYEEMLKALQAAKASKLLPSPQAPAMSPASRAPALPASPEETLNPPVVPMEPSSPFGEDLDDAALKAAQADRNQALKDALIAKGAAMFGSGVGGLISGTKPIDTSKMEALADEDAKIRGMKVADLEERRKGKKSEIEFSKMQDDYQDAAKRRDPNSELSQFARSEFKRMFGKDVPENVSVEQMRDAGYNLGTLLGIKETAEARKEAAKAAREDRALSREAMRQQRGIQNIGKLQDNYNKDKAVVAATEGLSSADTVEKLLDSNIPISDEAVKTLISKLSGQVGVLTDRDVAVYGGSQALKARVAQAIKTMVEGKLTDENRGFLRGITQILKEKQSSLLEDRARHHAKQGAVRLGMSEEEALEGILPGQSDAILNKKTKPASNKPASTTSQQSAPQSQVVVTDKRTGAKKMVPADLAKKLKERGLVE